jgi:long-chain fatty acid transport protein
MSPFCRQALKTGFICPLLGITMLAGNAHAAGFGIIEQSVTGLGAAFSTGSTAAGDGSTVYYNPAGMSFLKKRTAVTFGAHIIDPNARFKDEGSTNILASAILMSPQDLNVNNENGGDAGPISLVPNFYYTRAINDNWTAGIGINAPFGLTTDYDDGWVGRYYALTSELKTININPSLAYRASDQLSFGGGINIQYIDASLSNAVDFGSIFAATMAVAPQGADGEATVEGDDWSFGYNLGMLWQATPETRVGVAYRSRIKHKLEGDVDFRSSAVVSALIANPAFNPTGAFADGGDVSADITLPDSFSVGFQHQVNSKLAINGDITWTNWSLLDELRIEFDNPADADNVTTLKWEDSNRYSLGVTYQQNSQWTWRAGIAFDEAVTPNSRFFTPRVPDEDRTWLTAGFTYKPSSNMSFDMGYAHLFVEDASVNKSATDVENLSRGALVGKYELDVNILSAQARWAF